MSDTHGADEDNAGRETWGLGATLWFEIWADSVSGVWMPYLLVVRATSLGAFDIHNPHSILDPFAAGELIASFGQYGPVLDWMAEQGYHRVEGRWSDAGPVQGSDGDAEGERAIPELGDEWLPAWGEGETRWFEVWVDAYGARWHIYLSVVRASGLGALEVTDPARGGELFWHLGDYSDLLELMRNNR